MTFSFLLIKVRESHYKIVNVQLSTTLSYRTFVLYDVILSLQLHGVKVWADNCVYVKWRKMGDWATQTLPASYYLGVNGYFSQNFVRYSVRKYYCQAIFIYITEQIFVPLKLYINIYFFLIKV